MPKFDALCCPKNLQPISSGTITGGTFTVPAGANSITLTIHSSGGVTATGGITASWTWAGSTRTWNLPNGTNAAVTFTAAANNTIYEVNYTI